MASTSKPKPIRNLLYSDLYYKGKSSEPFFSILLFSIPLILSAFTHLWNPIGFPVFHVDEGHYMRRTMQVMHGLGPQESVSTYEQGYDHPYFGQLFIATVLSLINYPDFLNPTVGDVHSIEMLYLVPRVLMGVLAVIDTFLVYKIAETRYNRKVAFISSVLFAVMPLSWMLRGIFLDSIQLPFLLLSILFALYYVKRSERYFNDSSNNERNRNTIIIPLLLSGIFLGLAIFTKLPAFTMIPLIVFILVQKKGINKRIGYNYGYGNNIDQRNKSKSIKTRISSLKPIGIWFVPVILIPMIWPAYAMYTGQLDDWFDGILYQATRDPHSIVLRSSIILIFKTDPVLIGLAAAGLIYAIVKRDYFILLWTFPYVIFLYTIGWVTHFHWIPVLPLLCIAPSIILEMLKQIVSKKLGNILVYSIVSVIVFSGFLLTITMITSSLNTQYLRLSLFVNQELAYQTETDQASDSDTTTMVGSHRTRALMWIPKFVFNSEVIFRDTDIPNENFTRPMPTEKFMLVADSNLLSRLNNENHLLDYIGDRRVAELYFNASEPISTYLDMENEKYDFMGISENHGLGRFIEIRANY